MALTGFVGAAGNAATLRLNNQHHHAAAAATSSSARVVVVMRAAGGNNKRPFSFGNNSNSKRGGNFSNGGAGKNGGGNNAGNGRGSGGGSSGPLGAGGSGESAGASNPLMAFWNAYNSALKTNPLLIKALTSLVGFSLGDILAQKFLGSSDSEFDFKRLARMAAFGFCLHGTTGHYFYGALDRAIPGTEAWKVAAKVGIDQLLWAPIFTVMFFTFIGALEGRSKDEIVNKVKRDTWTGVSGSWKVWPLVHVINFRFIPSSQRLLYINTIQIAYNVFLSMIANKSDTKAPAPAIKGRK